MNHFFEPSVFREVFFKYLHLRHYYKLIHGVMVVVFMTLLAIIAFKGFVLCLWGFGGSDNNRNRNRSSSRSATRSLPSIIHTLPYNNWELTKVIVKINTLTVAFLLLPALMIGYSPFWVSQVRPGGENMYYVPIKGVLLLWVATWMFSALQLTESAHMLSSIMKLLLYLSTFILGYFLLISLEPIKLQPWQELASLAVLSILAAVWYFHCGKRYCQGRMQS
jgi:hypothetical protein